MTGPQKRSLKGVLVVASLFQVLAGGQARALDPKPADTPLAQRELSLPALAVSSANKPLREIQGELSNREAWEGFVTAQDRSDGGDFEAFIDPRSGTATNLLGRFPVIPGTGVGNQVTLEQLSLKFGRPVTAVDSDVVGDAVLHFAYDHADILAVDTSQLGPPRTAQVHADLWQVNIPQMYSGIPVRRGRLAGTISHGNLVVIGTERWSNVRDLSTSPAVDAARALEAGFAHAGGRTAEDEVVRGPELEIAPVAPPEHPEGEAFAGTPGTGYDHRLVWSFVFRRASEEGNWEVLVDAQTAEVLSFEDINHYAQAAISKKSITGGVYPLTNTEICPNAQTCGALQSGWPMPFADTGLAAPNNFTNSGGIFDYAGGTATTTLTGKYVDIIDSCGAVNNSASGSILLGGVNGQHDCTSGGGSPGNTASSRSAFYEVNKLAEMARGWLPLNLWLQSRLPTRVNRPATCNAFYDLIEGSINFYRSGGGCRNTGEIAAVFDHEWGHAMDDNDTLGVLSNSSEAYADIAAIYRLQASCVGHGFFWTSNRGCGKTADGTGYNANEAQVGASHCALDCSGVRDADWDKHADHQPDTALGFVCGSCAAGNGPCLRQVHCAAAPSRQAAWDLVARDLPGAPFNLDSQTAFVVGNRLFYQGSGNIGDWHSCICSASSDGCGATNGYMQWLAADDDNGLLLDGTPHMTALHAAFHRHGIACAVPQPANSGCGTGPTTSPSVVASPGSYQVALSWNAVPGAVRYWVFRTEGHAGCNFGKTLIGETELTAFTDTTVANGRTYYYNVAAVGASSSCFSRLSNCAAATPGVSIQPTAGASR